MVCFPFTAQDPVVHAGPLPKAVDVVVIGAGVVGVMTAWHLAVRGVRVMVAEKGRVAAEQSSRNWGWVRQQGRDPAELPIMIEANRIWRGLEGECGERFGFVQSGVTYLARNDAEMAPLEHWIRHAREHGLDTRVIGREGVAALMRGARRHGVGGIHTASDARAEPLLAVPALARAAARRGVVIREDCAVRCLDLSAGRIAGVVTERGRVRCEQVVLAGGAWSSLFARHHGIELPQIAVVSSVAATAPLPARVDGAASEAGFAVRRREDGGYTIARGGFRELYLGPDVLRNAPSFQRHAWREPFATRLRLAAPRGFPDAWRTPRRWRGDEPTPFEGMRVLDPAPNRRALERAAARFADVFPDLGRPALRATWAGMIDVTPDIVPVIDRAASVPGLVIATGMSGHGFGIGPGIGRVVADLTLERPVGHDLSRFRLARFSDGSPIEAGSSL